MKKDNGKNIIIVLLVFIIIILITLVFLFATNTITLNNDSSNTSIDIEDNNIENDNIKEQTKYEDYEEVITIDSTGESYTVKYDFTEQENYLSIVEDNDRIVTITEPISINQLYILDSGNLYFYAGKNTDLNNRDISKMGKYEELDNIKRIKSTHTTPVTGISLFLITNSGEIFSLSYNIELLKFDLNKIEEFGNYKFDDIISYEPAHGPGGSTYSVILQDGTILTKTIALN